MLRVLKETVFLSWIPFGRQAQKKSDIRLLFIDLFICCLNRYLCYRRMNYDTWLCGLGLCRHYGVSITLPALLFFPSSSSLLKCACLFQFVKLTRTSYEIE